VHALWRLGPSERELFVRRVGEAGFEVVWLSNEAQLERELVGIEILLVGRSPRIDWSAAKHLRLLQVAGTGVDPMFCTLDPPPSAWVANTRGAHASAVRDHALALLLAFARDLPILIEQQQRAEWQGFAVESVDGKVLTLVGLGEVGRGLAKAGVALGLKVRAVRRHVRSEPGVEVYAPEQLVTALTGADYVVLCVPATRETRDLIGVEALGALPRHAVLINVSRGDILDPLALEDALRSGRLRGAALDVFEEEPLPAANPLWSCPGLLITPHVAGWTPDYVARVLDVFVENLALYEQGMPPRTLVSALGY